jgi:hypothetical protein
MADKIYRLKHPSGDYTGFFGVDFYHGYGSTSNKNDADRLVRDHGFILVEGETDGTGAEKSAPVPDLPVAPAEYTAEPVVEIPAEKPEPKLGRKIRKVRL